MTTNKKSTSKGKIIPKTKKTAKSKKSVPQHNTKETALKFLPKGWVKIEGAMTAPNGYYWASNNKSYFSGERKQALVKIRENPDATDRDKLFLAKAPGKRISKSGKVYYEYRSNHTDDEEEQKTHGIKKVTGLRRAAKPHENNTRKLDYEWVLGLDKYGKEAFKRTDHVKNRCSVDGMPDNLALVTHNHPSSSSFSDPDIHVAIACGVGEMRVASELYDYYLWTHPEQWKQKGFSSREAYARKATDRYREIDIDLRIEKYNPKVIDDYRDSLKAKGIDWRSYQRYGEDNLWDEICKKYARMQTHETMTKLSKEFGFVYKRIRKRGGKHGK